MSVISEIQQVKDKVGQQAEQIIANGLNLVMKSKKYRCPDGFAHRNGDKTPSLSWHPESLMFNCFGCGLKIDIYDYYKKYLNYTHNEIVREILGKDDFKNNEMQKNRDRFKTELQHIDNLTKECIDYIKLRGLTEETIKAFELKTYKGSIAFPYYRNGTLTGYKTRKPIKNTGHPKMLSIPGSKPFLYNMQNLDFQNTEELIICEGEFDCMIIYQCGFKNVVSVGAGASSMTALFEQAKEIFDRFNSLIIVSDNDNAGSKMDELFVNKFKEKAKLIDKNLYKRNDINEEYAVFGEKKVIDIIESGRWKIEGRRDLDKKPYTGLKAKTGKYIPTGINTVDFAINDLAPGAVTLIAGRTNGGKTTFTKQIIANAIEKDNKVYLVSGEGDQDVLINEIYKCVIGRNKDYYDYVKINKRNIKEPKREVLKALQQWHRGKLVIFSKGESKLKTIEELFEMIEHEIKINRHNLVVVDNLMSILTAQTNEKWEMQGEFLQRCVNLAQNYRSHIIVVLHPNKTYQKGRDLEIEQISGTQDLGNKADNIISVIREYDDEKINQGFNGKIAVIKNRYFSDLPIVDIHFEEETGLLLEIDEETGEYIGYGFSWDKYLKGFKNSIRQDFIEVERPEDCPF